MSEYSSRIAKYENDYITAQQVQKKIDDMTEKLAVLTNQYSVMLEAQQLLATVSNNNTTVVLDYITGIINKTLANLFPHDSRRIYLEKTLYQNQYAHIIIKLTGTGGKPRDIQLQSGTGLRQVISFLFVITLIEIRKGRPLLLMDELLSGLHPTAKVVIKDIINIFAEEGVQFIMVEYGLVDIGKLYLVEKPNAIATIHEYGSDAYHQDIFKFNRPPEEVDLSIRINEEESDEVVNM